MQTLHSPPCMNPYQAGIDNLGTELPATSFEVALLRTFVTVISPLFLIPNTSAMLPGMDIFATGQERRHMESTTRLPPGRERRTCSWGLTELQSSLGTKKRKPESELPRVTLKRSPSLIPGHQLWLKITADDFS